MEYLKNLLLKIVRNDIDHFDVVTEGSKFGIDFSEASGFLHEKYLLKHAVITELLKNKEDAERDKLVEMYETTGKLLNLKQLRPAKGYPCSLVGCLFRGKNYRDYLKHLERVHRSINNFLCFHNKKCQRNFTSISELKDHVNVSHKQKKDHVVLSTFADNLLQVGCKCNMVSCGETIFQSMKELASHFNTRHKSESRECIFQDCDTKFGPNSISKNHFRLKHFNLRKIALKAVHVIDDLALSSGEDNQVDENFNNDFMIEDDNSEDDATYEEGIDSEDDMTTESVQDDAEVENFFLMSYADFLNRLINYKFIPVSTVREIAAEFFGQSLRSGQDREALLRRSLSQIPNMNPKLLEEILKENTKDPFLKAQEELSSEDKRNKFMEENFQYVKPREIILNKEETKYGVKKEVVHYIPIIEAFKVLVEDKSFIHALENAAEEDKLEEKELIKDVKDGLIYKRNNYFRENPEAFAILMYSDGVELTNPLASGKGKHKIVQLFWTLGEIPRFQRSTIDRLQLGLVFKEKLLKKFSHAQIFKCLIEDLVLLESEGVDINEPVPRTVKAGLLLYSGDNLEAHLIGGYSTCFSSKDVCRFCHIQYSDLEDHIHNFDGESVHEPWTIEEYDSHEVPVEEYEDEMETETTANLFTEFEDPTEVPEDGLAPAELQREQDLSVDEYEETEEDLLAKNFGLKHKCVFNQLKAFHCVTSMPPDSLHDLMEGVLPQDLLGIIRILINKGWFSLDDYNKALRNIKYSRQESSNKPQQVPSSPRIKKLTGKAVSNWVHIRIFSLILHMKGWVVDSQDPVLILALRLHDVTDRLTAEKYEPHEVDIIDNLVIEYLNLRKEVYNQYPVLGNPKPKHHFLHHYAEAIRNFGPPSSYWTGRYESKHRVAKSVAEASKNFINISHTISQRQQMRMCSTYYNGMFSSGQFSLPSRVISEVDLSDSDLHQKLKHFMTSRSDLLCMEIEFNCRKYKEGDIIVIRRNDQVRMEVGLIKTFLVRKSNVFVIARKYIVEQNHLLIFESKAFDSDLILIKMAELKDSYPLFKRGTEEKFFLGQHHHISFSFN